MRGWDQLPFHSRSGSLSRMPGKNVAMFWREYQHKTRPWQFFLWETSEVGGSQGGQRDPVGFSSGRKKWSESIRLAQAAHSKREMSQKNSRPQKNNFPQSHQNWSLFHWRTDVKVHKLWNLRLSAICFHLVCAKEIIRSLDTCCWNKHCASRFSVSLELSSELGSTMEVACEHKAGYVWWFAGVTRTFHISWTKHKTVFCLCKIKSGFLSEERRKTFNTEKQIQSFLSCENKNFLHLF